MRKIYVFPLVGSILLLFGLCLPVVYLYDDITIWLWGFYMVESKSLVDFRITNEKGFDAVLRSIMILSFCFFIFILVSFVFIIRISIQMKRKYIPIIKARQEWDRRALIFIASLVCYMVCLIMIIDLQDFCFKNGIFIQFLGGIVCLVPSFSRLKKLSYKINKFITLKLKNYETVIYIADKPFEICKHLILDIPVRDVKNINSLDELIDGYGEKTEEKFISYLIDLDPKEIFKGHCSNLQVWAENDYDTCLLRNNLAFPLIKRLTEVGDQKAVLVFKDEVKKRFESLYAPVQFFLISEGYLKYFSEAERQELLGYVSDIEILFEVGDRFLLNSQLEKAIDAYEYALEIDPINKSILKKLLELSTNVKDSQRVIKYKNTLSELYGQ